MQCFAQSNDFLCPSYKYWDIANTKFLHSPHPFLLYLNQLFSFSEMGRVSAKEDFHFCHLQQTVVEKETELGFQLLLKIHCLDPESSNNFIKILILGVLFLGQGLIRMVLKGL